MEKLSEDSRFLFLLTDISLTDEQKKILSERLELLEKKYSNRSMQTDTEEQRRYYDGVVDGLIIAYKMINEIGDDYLLK